MYTPENSPFEKFRTEKLKGVAMSPDVRELVALAYESGFIDGMSRQAQSSVDRAVNRTAEQPERPTIPDGMKLVPSRCPLCEYQHGHQIGCENNPVDIHLRQLAAAPQQGTK